MKEELIKTLEKKMEISHSMDKERQKLVYERIENLGFEWVDLEDCFNDNGLCINKSTGRWRMEHRKGERASNWRIIITGDLNEIINFLEMHTNLKENGL
jgi:hypothetical protein